MAKKPSQSPSKDDSNNVFWEVVPEGHLQRLKEKREKHIAHAIANKVTYPDPDKIHLLTEVKIQKLGFTGHELDDLLDLEPLASHGGRRHRRNKGSKGNQGGNQGGKNKKGGGNKGGGGGKKLPNPSVAEAVVRAALQATGLKPVTGTGDVVAVELNCENCDDTKVKWFSAAFKLIFEHADLAYLGEVTCAAVTQMATLTGYKGICSAMNSRGQAVGFLVNPNRFDIIGQTEEWKEVANVQGIQDLRPAVKITIKDKVTGRVTHRVVSHLKSMRGGPKVTEPVRYQQFQKIAARMGVPVQGCKPQLGQLHILQFFKNPQIGRGLTDHAANYWIEREPAGVQCVDGMWVFAGDCNDFLGQNTKVYDPMTKAGYLLLYPNDTTSTQSMGGRLDGAFRDVSTGTACGGSASGPFADNTSDSPTVAQ